jgi:hypothetical protein
MNYSIEHLLFYCKHLCVFKFCFEKSFFFLTELCINCVPLLLAVRIALHTSIFNSISYLFKTYEMTTNKPEAQIPSLHAIKEGSWPLLSLLNSNVISRKLSIEFGDCFCSFQFFSINKQILVS